MSKVVTAIPRGLEYIDIAPAHFGCGSVYGRGSVEDADVAMVDQCAHITDSTVTLWVRDHLDFVNDGDLTAGIEI